MPIILFLLFAAISVAGAVMLVAFRNPVSSALAMVLAFAGMAGLFIGLDAFLVGIIQILVYAGAIMVLFLFIIMLLDLNLEVKRTPKLLPAVAGVAVAAAMLVQLAGVLGHLGDGGFPPLDLARAAQSFPAESKVHQALAPPAGSGRRPALPDIRLIARDLFTHRNLELQIVGTLLLVATVGVVVLSRKPAGPQPPDGGK
jgi:NADH-quinone oxidoreductase subunit J